MTTDRSARPARTFPIVRVVSLAALGISAFSLMTTHDMRLSRGHQDATLHWASESGRTTLEVSCRSSADCEASRDAIRRAFPAVHPVERPNDAPYRFFGIL